VLSASGSPGWIPNQYVGNGYSVCNLDKSAGGFPWCSNITANTANTITYSTGNCSECTWDSTNRFEVRQVTACVDMPGLGAGTLLSGNPPTPTGWTNQVVEPIYVWGNTHSSVTNNVLARVSETGGRVIENTHYYQCLGAACDSAAWLTKGSLRGYSGTTVTRLLLGYTPYTYPHPLATCGAATCGVRTIGGDVTNSGRVTLNEQGEPCATSPCPWCSRSSGCPLCSRPGMSAARVRVVATHSGPYTLLGETTGLGFLAQGLSNRQKYGAISAKDSTLGEARGHRTSRSCLGVAAVKAPASLVIK
jgi:hypothetical protein